MYQSTDMPIREDGFLTPEMWTYVALSYSEINNVFTIWRNGRKYSKRNIAPDFVGNTNVDFLFINYLNDFTSTSPGKLRCLQLYDNILSARQIQKLIVNCQGISRPLTSGID